MVYNYIQESYSPSRRTSARFLAFSFLTGFLFGIYAGVFQDASLFPMMCGIINDSVSIVCLIGILLIPFVISASAFWIDPAFLFPICFLRAFLYAFIHLTLLRHYSDCGFVIRWLILTSDCLSLPLLYLFWYRRISGYSLNLATLITVCAMVCGIGFFDFYTVTPFWTTLLILQKG